MSSLHCGLFLIAIFILQVSVSWPMRRFLGISQKSKKKRSRFTAAAIHVEGSDVQLARPLGSYEKLLSRQIPGSATLALSHGCTAVLSSVTSHDELKTAFEKSIKRHPMLRVYIHHGQNGSKEFAFAHMSESAAEIARKALLTEEFIDSEAAARTIEMYTCVSVNQAIFSATGPLWRVNHIKDLTQKQSTLVFTFNHGIDDQRAVNIVIADILHLINARRISSSTTGLGGPLPLPPPIESAVSQGLSLRTLHWALFQTLNGLSKAVMLPDHISRNKRREPAFSDPNQRKTILRRISLSTAEMDNIKVQCKRRGLSVTHLLSAAIISVTARYIVSTTAPRDIMIRFLLSVGLRPYHENPCGSGRGDFTGETVACASGAVDYVLKCPAVLMSDTVDISPQTWDAFFSLARCSQEQATFVLEQATFVPESVTLMDIGFRTVDILQAVELDANNVNTLGRGYTCGVSNMGVVDFVSSRDKQLTFADMEKRLQVQEIYYATSHGRNGNLCQLSCMTLANCGNWYGCLQFPWPIITEEGADDVQESLLRLLKAVAALF